MSVAALTALADRLIGRLSGPVDLTEGEAFVGATIGIARLPGDGATAEAAVRNADLALYTAKEAGRGRAQLFQPIYAQAVDQRLDLARRMCLCACRKSNPNIFVVQSAEDWAAKNAPCPLHSAR